MNRSVKFSGALGLFSVGLLIIAVALQGAARSTSAAQGATVRLVPGSQNVRLGDDVEIDVVIDDATNIAAFEFRLKYDPDVLKLEGVTATDFLKSTGRGVFCQRATVDPVAVEPGNVWFGCATQNKNGGPPVSGSGVVARLTFSTSGPGLTYLTFSRMPLLADDMSEDCCAPVSLTESAVRVIAPDQPTPADLPATPTRNPAALTPTPIAAAPTPSTWLTPEPGATPMSRTVESARASGTTGSSGNSASQGTAGGSPRAGEGPGKADPAWWPPLVAGLLAIAGASLLPFALYLRGAGVKRRI